MKIAIASGKGGTGKTTVAASLALSLQEMSQSQACLSVQNRQYFFHTIQFLDCDVEAPNAHLFFNLQITSTSDVNLQVPEVDTDRCTWCGTCASVCQYHAITVIGKNTMVFPQLCHGCGSCKNVCPENAIHEVPSPIGVINKGTTDHGISFSYGLLNIGEPMAVPIIRELKRSCHYDSQEITVLDSPPGNSCPMVETIRDIDFVILVTEPTPFGLHDLRLAVDIIKSMGIPAGIILNRYGISSKNDVERYAEENHIPILLRIPFRREIAEATARGKTLIDILPEYKPVFINLMSDILSMVNQNE